jgi:hypothetical protein
MIGRDRRAPTAKRRASKAWSALGALLVYACGNVEHPAEPVTPNGGEPPLETEDTTPESMTCEQYCEAVMQACEGDNAVYVNVAVCLAVCAQLEAGDALEPHGNTLACRAAHARLARSEPDAQCAAAGPGGAGSCGSDCEAYCALYPRICPDEADAQGSADCLVGCEALVDQDRFNVVADHGGDTVECRLVHVSAAAIEPSVHCAHARLEPTEPWCVSAP